jgi:tetratricopeptide (TPR) repeat protein
MDADTFPPPAGETEPQSPSFLDNQPPADPDPANDDAGPTPPPDGAQEAGVFDIDACMATADELQRQGHSVEAENLYTLALSSAPERADIWTNLGLAMLSQNRVEEAVQCERTALRIEPENVEALNNLGIAMHASNALAEAQSYFRAALLLDPKHANATLNLGVIRQSLGHLEEAEALYRAARELGTDEARACNNLGLVLAEMGQLVAAETACREALTAKPGYPEASVNLGMILLMQGNLEQGWSYYEARWKVAPLAGMPQLPDATRWTGGESLMGKTILLLAEQGFGDAVQFCRYAPIVANMGVKVILAVPDPLLRLMGSLAGVDQVVSQDDVLPAFDLHCPLMSLPMVLDTTEDTIPWRVPYLTADPDAIERWEKFIPSAGPESRLRVGLVWAGARRPNQLHAAAIDQRRSMKLEEMAPLGLLPGCTFVSLQLGPPAKQIETAPFPLLDVADQLTDFAETAALIDVLDLVITVDTAVAHVAGALGKPVWLLSRSDACWRWMRDRDDSPWYPTMRLFRQTTPGDWAGVMRRVAAALPRFQTFG